jgi:excisionase family DNA binding protein
MQHSTDTTTSNATGQEHPGSLLTSSQLARFLGCSDRHVFNLRKRGMPAYRIGEIVRFDLDQVRRWLDSNGEAAPANGRLQQLADVAATGDGDNAECAAADLAHEQT